MSGSCKDEIDSSAENDNKSLSDYRNCAIVGAITLLYILFFLLVIIIIIRCCRTRRLKQKKRSSFNLPQDNNGLLSSMLNSRSNRDDNEQNNQHGRISGGTYSEVKLVNSANIYDAQQSDTYSKLREQPVLSTYSHLQSHGHVPDKMEHLKSSSPSPPPPLPNEPPPRSKPRTISVTQKADEVIVVEVELTQFPQMMETAMHGKNDIDLSNAYSLAKKFNDDDIHPTENTAHCFSMSRSCSSDMYSLANHSGDISEFPAEYEGFYSVPSREEIDEADSSCDDNESKKSNQENILMREATILGQERKKKQPVPPPVTSRPRSVSNIERKTERNKKPSAITTASFRKPQKPYMNV